MAAVTYTEQNLFLGHLASLSYGLPDVNLQFLLVPGTMEGFAALAGPSSWTVRRTIGEAIGVATYPVASSFVMHGLLELARQPEVNGLLISGSGVPTGGDA
jgi:hypothetical protein